MTVTGSPRLFALTRPAIGLVLLLLGYAALIGPFAGYMHRKPTMERLGQVPSVKLLQFVSADQKQLAGASLVFKVLIYFGGLFEDDQVKFTSPPDYPAMSRMLHAAVALDPYNMDAYYFAQSILVWDVGQIKAANDLLDYGMKYRTWDWYLPFFAGFNHAYFLKDYAAAAKYYRMAGELSGQPLFINLAGRYMHEAGETSLALSYLSAMAKSASNPGIKKIYLLRLDALEKVRAIEIARDGYTRAEGHLPRSVDELVKSGYLKSFPQDPYGGAFYLEPDGKVQSTSKFAPMKKKP